jgi:hypothetical protein
VRTGPSRLSGGGPPPSSPAHVQSPNDLCTSSTFLGLGLSLLPTVEQIYLLHYVLANREVSLGSWGTLSREQCVCVVCCTLAQSQSHDEAGAREWAKC